MEVTLCKAKDLKESGTFYFYYLGSQLPSKEVQLSDGRSHVEKKRNYEKGEWERLRQTAANTATSNWDARHVSEAILNPPTQSVSSAIIMWNRDELSPLSSAQTPDPNNQEE